jgi:hypothetical protein
MRHLQITLWFSGPAPDKTLIAIPSVQTHSGTPTARVKRAA